MKVKFKTEYLLGRVKMKAGDILDVSDPLASYLVEELKVAEYIKEGDKSGKGEG